MILMRDEWFLGFSGVTCVLFLLYGETLFARLAEPAWLALIFLWLFTAMLGSALSVVRLAEQLAIRLGEPYGTLLLTLSVTFVEVTSIAAIMSHGAIILNGMVGLSLPSRSGTAITRMPSSQASDLCGRRGAGRLRHLHRARSA